MKILRGLSPLSTLPLHSELFALHKEVLQYAKDLFKEQIEDHQFVQAAQQHAIQNGFKDLDPSFVGMLTAATTNKNDLASKSLAPA